MSDRDVLDMDLEDEENEEKLLNETNDTNDTKDIEDELDKDDEEPNATEDSIERQIQQVIEKGIEDDEKEKSSQDDDRKSDSKSQKSDTSDDEMERLRKEALSSKNSSRRRHSSSRSSRSDRDRRKTRRDSCESRSNSDDDALTEMRRKLLADRAQRKPNDLRARLARGKQISAFINPNLSPKQPVTIKDQANNQIQFPNFKVGRTVVNSGSKPVPESKPKREIISESKSKFKITRTVKNEISKSDIIIDTRDSTDSDERIEVNLKGSKKSKKGKSSRSVFQTASEMYVESADDSLDEITSESESSEGDQMYVLKAGDKRGVTKKIKKSKKRDQSPILKSSITREIRSIAKSDSKKAKKMTDKEVELERKMDRIRRDNEKREKRARLVEKERRKYGSAKLR